MLCRLSKRKNQSITDWGEQHAKYETEWNQWKTRKDVERRVIDWEEYSQRWHQASSAPKATVEDGRR